MTTILNLDFQVYEVHIIIMYMWFVIAIIYISIILLHNGEGNLKICFPKKNHISRGLYCCQNIKHITWIRVLIIGTS